MRLATASAARAGTPWVLDPVAVGALAYRTELAAGLLASRPAVVRGNASEVMALAGAGSGGRGVDSTARSTTPSTPRSRWPGAPAAWWP
jgi:hydroxyethylthiazole kinase